MINVLAFITTKPGMRNTVLSAFQDNVPAVLAEDGCIEYGAAIDVADGGPIQTPVGPDTFVVIEKWESMAALGAHGKSAHMRAYGASVKEMLEKREIMLLTAP